jgi:hypothetical protein
VFQAIADPSRTAFVLLVASHSMTTGAIAANIDTARPTVSNSSVTIGADQRVVVLPIG